MEVWRRCSEKVKCRIQKRGTGQLLLASLSLDRAGSVGLGPQTSGEGTLYSWGWYLGGAAVTLVWGGLVKQQTGSIPCYWKGLPFPVCKMRLVGHRQKQGQTGSTVSLRPLPAFRSTTSLPLAQLTNRRSSNVVLRVSGQHHKGWWVRLWTKPPDPVFSGGTDTRLLQ